MTKQMIEVDVPNGYEISKIEYFSDSQYIKVRIKEKIRLRRIVLEETDEDTNQIQQYFEPGFITTLKKKWREVKETDISLTKEEPNDKSKWAEDLILQLDASHEGRNSWLCHYGRSKQAEKERKNSIFEYVESDGRFNISKLKD